MFVACFPHFVHKELYDEYIREEEEVKSSTYNDLLSSANVVRGKMNKIKSSSISPLRFNAICIIGLIRML